MDNENRPVPLPEDYNEYDQESLYYCPKCESGNIRWHGGDNVVNLGKRPIFTRVDFWTCSNCGHKWSDSYDHE